MRCFDAGRRYLLLRVFNYWDFPKGEVEAGEDALRAAVPEVKEELGRPEHDEFRWVGYQGARALLAERVRPILDWANGHLRCER